METNHDLTLKLSLYLCLFFYVIRILLNVFLIAKVGHSSGSLLTAVVNHSTHRSRASNIEERRVIKSFLGRLEHTTLGANPSGFYKVSPSVLLTLLSLIVSYTIILLQSGSNDAKVVNN